jgi:hypothetical protein
MSEPELAANTDHFAAPSPYIAHIQLGSANEFAVDLYTGIVVVDVEWA